MLAILNVSCFESDVDETQTPKKYVLTWITAQLPLAVTGWMARAQLQTEPLLSAVVGGGWIFFSGFAVKVWKELEDDAVKGTAATIRATPRAVAALCGRASDALLGTIVRWSPGFSRNYLQALRFEYGLFNDRGLGLINANRLDLEKVYVELRASADVNLNRPHLNPVSRKIYGKASFWEHVRILKPSFALAIIGSPGSGKTTLLYHILLTFARHQQWRQRMRWRLPFFVELRKVASALQAVEQPTLPEIIESALKQNFTTLGKEPPLGWVDSRLRSGRCILLWDGLDEIANSDHRGKVSAWLDVQIKNPAWKGNLFLVSARPAGYRVAPLNRARVLEVQPFDVADTQRFIQRWYHANEIISAGQKDNLEVRQRAQREIVDLQARLEENPRINALTANPLLLTMLCMVHRYHGALPGSRGQLYAEICQVLLERWRQVKKIQDSYRADQKLAVLRPLAAYMMSNEKKVVALAEAIATIMPSLSLLGVHSEEAERFLVDLQDGSGLLLEQEAGTWSFAHLSFQEYLCAEHWAQQPENLPTAWSKCVQKSWWRETLLLYVTKAADASDVLAAALDENTTSTLVLAFDLLEENPNLQPSVRQRMGGTLSHALSLQNSELFEPAARVQLVRSYEHGYTPINDEFEISGYVTQWEYQLFLLRNERDAPVDAFPLHWQRPWFSGKPLSYVSGMSKQSAQRYCEWLDDVFSEWHHRLPLESEIVAAIAPPTEQQLIPWVDGADYVHESNLSPGVAVSIKSSLLVFAKRKQFHQRGLEGLTMDYADTNRALQRARSMSLKLISVRPRTRVRSEELASTLASALSNTLAQARKTYHNVTRHPTYNPDQEFANAIARDLSSAFVLVPKLITDPDLQLNLSVDPAITFDISQSLAYAYIIAFGFFEVDRRTYTPQQDSADHSHLVDEQLDEADFSAIPKSLDMVADDRNPFATRSHYRRFFVRLISWINNESPQALSGKKDRDFLQLPILLFARENRDLLAWEGIRIVRTLLKRRPHGSSSIGNIRRLYR